MNTLLKLFSEKKERILNIYFSSEFPFEGSTIPILKTLNDTDTDIIEIGLPYSDPLADGRTIQKSNQIAIEMGFNSDKLFEELKRVKKEMTKPYILMGYYNTMLQYGIEFFFQKSKEAGVSGLLFPDMPLRDFYKETEQYFKNYDICPIFLISPETTYERLKAFEKVSKGFLYLVSSSSTTGIDTPNKNNKTYVDFLQNHKISLPVLVGFGIKTKEDFDKVCQSANGGVIGSAFINVIESCTNEQHLQKTILDFVKKIRGK